MVILGPKFVFNVSYIARGVNSAVVKPFIAYTVCVYWGKDIIVITDYGEVKMKGNL